MTADAGGLTCRNRGFNTEPSSRPLAGPSICSDSPLRVDWPLLAVTVRVPAPGSNGRPRVTVICRSDQELIVTDGPMTRPLTVTVLAGPRVPNPLPVIVICRLLSLLRR